MSPTIYIIATQFCNYVTNECCVIFQMDKRLPRRSLPRSQESRTLSSQVSRVKNALFPGLKSQERSEVCWKSTTHTSLADGVMLSEALDPILMGSRLQEFGICSATLACGQQRERH